MYQFDIESLDICKALVWAEEPNKDLHDEDLSAGYLKIFSY